MRLCTSDRGPIGIRTLKKEVDHRPGFSGSRGIGRATSYELARLGYAIAVQYRADAAAAEQTVAALRERGSDSFALQADLAAPEGIENLFAEFDRIMRQRRQPQGSDCSSTMRV